ncbi:MAG: hypothetical protein EOO27_08175 [Comamonadaceae bacterium]|nr:MAG: hypothetical protein EOO27_08175 [Comamonadaceae bacterium]
MKDPRHFLPLVALALAATATSAQFIDGKNAANEMPGSTGNVETPPLPATGAATRAKPCAANAGCHPGPWHMVETSAGLRECTEPFARPTTCRESTYGSQKLSRLWIAKKGSVWLWCQYPDMAGKCVDMHARPPLNLPVSAIQ